MPLSTHMHHSTSHHGGTSTQAKYGPGRGQNKNPRVHADGKVEATGGFPQAPPDTTATARKGAKTRPGPWGEEAGQGAQ